MFKTRLTSTILLAIVSIITITCTTNTDTPLIHAAASLVDVLTEIQIQYENETNNKVRFNFAGSNLIANQIINGAPASAVILAGQTPIDKLIRADKTTQSQTTQILTNTLVAVKPSNSTASYETLRQLVGAGKIAMPDPATAPAGEYFQAALQELNLLEKLKPQIIPTLDVRAALAAAESGNVAYALVYQTDAITSPDVQIAFTIQTQSEQTEPKYYASPINNDTISDHFLNYLQTPTARTIFTKHGFTQ